MNETELKTYIKTKSNWATLNWKKNGHPRWSNTGSFIIGHKYRIHWGKTGIDFTSMSVYISEEYTPTDESLFFVHNFTDVRAKITVKHGGTIPNNTIPANPADYVTGQNLVLNNTNPNITRE